MLDDRLSLTVYHADGRTTRWGSDEDEADRLLTDLTFSTVAPGGFEALSCSLLRGLQPQADEGLGDRVVVYGAGGRVMWEGRLQQLPRQTGDRNLMSPQAVGYSAHLTDHKAFMEVYVNPDISLWGTPPVERRVSLAVAGCDTGKITAADLVWDVQSGNPLGVGTELEQFWVAPAGVKIARVDYTGIRTGSFTNFEGAEIFAADLPDLSGGITTSALTLNGAPQFVVLSTPRRYVMLRVYVTGTVTPAAGVQQSYSKVAVIGDHGLPIVPTATGDPGVLASDVIADVVTRCAPQLAFTTGANGTIQATTDAIGSASYLAPTTAAAVIQDVNSQHAWDWMVWEDRTFHYGPAASGPNWTVRRADGARLQLDGETFDSFLNEIYVSYTDGYGRLRYAGPPGSGADIEDPALADTNPANPANQQRIPHKNDLINLPFLPDDAAAVTIGSLELFERNAATRRSMIELARTVEHPTEAKVPVARVRAGDLCTVGDLVGDVPRRIIRTQYVHATRKVTVTNDNTPPAADAIIARVASATGTL